MLHTAVGGGGLQPQGAVAPIGASHQLVLTRGSVGARVAGPTDDGRLCTITLSRQHVTRYVRHASDLSSPRRQAVAF